MFIQEDIKLVEIRIKSFEQNTGCELLIVVASEADPYPAAPLRFGICSSFMVWLIFSYFYEFHHAWLWPLSFVLTTFFFTWLGHFKPIKKFALASWEVQREVREKAIELFHSLGTSQVKHKVTAMIMVSILERRIEVLVDGTLKNKLDQQQLDELVAIMQTHFKDGFVGAGLVNSISNLEEKILERFSGKVSDVNPSELKDTIHFITV